MPLVTIIWTEPATASLVRLYRFLEHKNKPAATRAIETIRQAVKTIENNPAIGRPVLYGDFAYRELLIGFGNSGYIALYSVFDAKVYILSVRHQKEAQNAKKPH